MYYAPQYLEVKSIVLTSSCEVSSDTFPPSGTGGVAFRINPIASDRVPCRRDIFVDACRSSGTMVPLIGRGRNTME